MPKTKLEMYYEQNPFTDWDELTHGLASVERGVHEVITKASDDLAIYLLGHEKKRPARASLTERDLELIDQLDADFYLLIELVAGWRHKTRWPCSP